MFQPTLFKNIFSGTLQFISLDLSLALKCKQFRFVNSSFLGMQTNIPRWAEKVIDSEIWTEIQLALLAFVVISRKKKHYEKWWNDLIPYSGTQ